MINVEIKKKQGIENLLDFKDKEVEIIKEVSEESKFKALLESFKNSLLGEPIGEGYDVVLTPKQIEAFLKASSIFENEPHYFGVLEKTLPFLIQKSYDHNQNDFFF